MSGPSAAPATLRLIDGRAPGRDSGGREVTPPPAFKRMSPNPPTWLSKEAKAEWKRVEPGLSRLDLLKPEDRSTFTAYCETWATWVAALANVRSEGFTVTNTSTRKDGSTSEWVTKNPAVGVMETAAVHLKQFAREFGLTPSAESALDVAKPDADDDDDPYD